MIIENKILSKKEQIDILKSNKEYFISELYGYKCGMPLYFPIVFNDFLEYKMSILLNKNIKLDLSEEEICNVFEEFDNIYRKNTDKFNWKEQLKIEIQINSISIYQRNLRLNDLEFINNSNYFKELKIKTDKLIDNFFKDNENFSSSEFTDVFDLFEAHTSDNGQTIDLHFGSFGFSITEEVDFSLNDFKMKINSIRSIRNFYFERIKKVNNELILLAKKFIKKDNPIFKKIYSNILENLIKEDSIEYIYDPKKEFINIYKNFIKTKRTLKDTDLNDTSFINFSIDDIKFNQNFDILYKNTLLIKFNEYKKLDEIIGNFNKVSDKVAILKEKINFYDKDISLSFVNNKLILNLSFSYEDNFKTKKFATVKNEYIFDIGKILRKNGDEILDLDVIIFEIFEKERSYAEMYENSLKNSKEMFLNTLSKKEKEMIEKTGIVFLEGEKYNYILNTKYYYYSLLRLDKISSENLVPNNTKKLCIVPKDPKTPIYDGFSTLVLCIKANDENYIDKNSNKFIVKSDFFKEIKEFLTIKENMFKV